MKKIYNSNFTFFTEWTESLENDISLLDEINTMLSLEDISKESAIKIAHKFEQNVLEAKKLKSDKDNEKYFDEIR